MFKTQQTLASLTERERLFAISFCLFALTLSGCSTEDGGQSSSRDQISVDLMTVDTHDSPDDTTTDSVLEDTENITLCANAAECPTGQGCITSTGRCGDCQATQERG